MKCVKNPSQNLMSSRLALLSLMGLVLPTVSHAAVIDFDDLPAISQLTSGSQYAAQGVTFTSGNIPNAVSIGDVITLANPEGQFLLISNVAQSVSTPNYASASFSATSTFFREDILMTFAAPVTSVQVNTDLTDPDPNGGDLVRLLALNPTGNPFEFTVVGITDALDNAVTPAASLVSVGNGGAAFSAAIFQVTSAADFEGFDNLTFQSAVPEPGSAALMAGAATLGGMLLRRRRKTVPRI